MRSVPWKGDPGPDFTVDVNDGHSDAVRFLRAHHVPYVAVHASSGTVESFGLVGLPETFYLDTRGHIDHVTRGQLSATELQQGITRAAAQQPSG